MEDEEKIRAQERRDFFAAAALTGLCGCSRCHDQSEYDATRFAHTAVEMADALIAELDKPPEAKP